MVGCHCSRISASPSRLQRLLPIAVASAKHCGVVERWSEVVGGEEDGSTQGSIRGVFGAVSAVLSKSQQAYLFVRMSEAYIRYGKGRQSFLVEIAGDFELKKLGTLRMRIKHSMQSSRLE